MRPRGGGGGGRARKKSGPPSKTTTKWVQEAEFQGHKSSENTLASKMDDLRS